MSAEEVDIDDVTEAVKATLTEEVVPEVIEAEGDIEKPIEKKDEEEVQFTEKELEAKDHGWNPEGKDRDGNTLSADEYLARKPLFNKIHNLQDKLSASDERYKGLEGQVGQLVEQNKQIAADKIKERETLMDQLAAAKENALTNLDVDQVRAIDDKMDTVRKELKETPETKAPVTNEITPAYQEFIDENEWAKDESSALYSEVTRIAENFVQSNVKAGNKITEAEVYAHAAKQVKELYPHKFEDNTAPRTPKIGNNNQRQPIKPVVTKKTINDIPEEQRAIAKEVMESTGQTIDEYLAVYNF
jgi:regulator of replication initiation timing